MFSKTSCERSLASELFKKKTAREQNLKRKTQKSNSDPNPKC